ncbi:hypothetical protein [Pseudomonas sp. RIT-PI-S]|uniref:hypothetical protein n=1 Tax=Pseudomonas sp. RIT-PI-S TaxID=3035295 RepID=UPI0021D9E892|nr:hypothetical protein [Pseudomonas sp. RIT-PI-S]
MRDLRVLLERLDPPLRHSVETRGDEVLLTLEDPQVPAKVQRNLEHRQWHNDTVLAVILLHAINELRGKGSHAPLEAFTLA